MGKKKTLAAKVIAVILLGIFCVPMPAFAAKTPVLDKHIIHFERAINARDIGDYKTKNGKHVKKGVLIRSGELSYLSAKDKKLLRKTYHLGTIVDFRYNSDFKYCPDKSVKGAKLVKIPARYRKTEDNQKSKSRYARMKKKSSKNLRAAARREAERVERSYMYGLVMDSYSQKAYKQYFNVLLNNKSGKPILFHCVNGKDRTGVAAFMTLIALGVDEKTAYKEFGLTNVYLKKYSPKNYAKYKLGVNTDDLKYAVGQAKKKYGSMNKFLSKAYGLDAKKIKKLKKMYTY